jgi:hypothetical protein
MLVCDTFVVTTDTVAPWFGIWMTGCEDDQGVYSGGRLRLHSGQIVYAAHQLCASAMTLAAVFTLIASHCARHLVWKRWWQGAKA